jgi:hypothetical protein
LIDTPTNIRGNNLSSARHSKQREENRLSQSETRLSSRIIVIIDTAHNRGMI